MPPLPPETPSSRPPMQGGGCLIAAGLVIGPIMGLLVGQTSLGLLAGLAIGVVGAIVIAVRDRRR